MTDRKILNEAHMRLAGPVGKRGIRSRACLLFSTLPPPFIPLPGVPWPVKVRSSTVPGPPADGPQPPLRRLGSFDPSHWFHGLTELDLELRPASVTQRGRDKTGEGRLWGICALNFPDLSDVHNLKQ